MAGIVALAGVVWFAVGVLSAVFMHAPGLLAVSAPMALIVPISALLLLRPISLSSDGDQIVLRSSRKENRIQRNEIARCALIGRAWTFSDAGGAQLLTLPAVRFSADEVAAFCSAAGIELAGVQRPVDQLRADVRSAKVSRIVSVILGVILLGAAGAAAYAQNGARNSLAQYRSAPVCSSVTPASSDCRTMTQARVTSTTFYKNGTTCHVTLLTAGGDYLVWVSLPLTPHAGDVTDVELWGGDVTRLGGERSGNNPETSPNLDLVGAIAVVLLFFSVTMVGLGLSQWQLVHARERLHAAVLSEGGTAARVQRIQPDTTTSTLGLPPCGIAHQPKEVFLAHPDPRLERLGLRILVVLIGVIIVVSGFLAIKVSALIFGPIGVMVAGYLALQAVTDWRTRNVSGVFADDLHVGKLSTSYSGRLVRKVFDRSAVLQCNVSSTNSLSVVGVDGSTLFTSSVLAPADVDRFLAFVGARVVRESPAQPDSIAVAPIKTPMGVLPLRIRRAAGLMQAVGGICAGLAVVNALLLGLRGPADRRVFLFELLAMLAIYGACLIWLGLRLGQGRPRSRETALIGSGAVTALAIAAQIAIGMPLQGVAIFAVLFIGIYALLFMWLREPVTA